MSQFGKSDIQHILDKYNNNEVKRRDNEFVRSLLSSINGKGHFDTDDFIDAMKDGYDIDLDREKANDVIKKLGIGSHGNNGGENSEPNEEEQA